LLKLPKGTRRGRKAEDMYELQGDEDIDAKRSRPSSENP
jgi:hypothetical protein